MQTEMKLANECVNCLTAFMRSRASQEIRPTCGGVEGAPETHQVDYFHKEHSERREPMDPGGGARCNEQDLLPALASVNSMMAARNARLKFFDHDLFFDPAWAMLLDLYRSELLGKSLCVSSLCLGSGVPGTTALRYLRILEDRGYVERIPDELDKRRSFVRLATRTRDAMASYVESLRSSGIMQVSRR